MICYVFLIYSGVCNFQNGKEEGVHWGQAVGGWVLERRDWEEQEREKELRM